MCFEWDLVTSFVDFDLTLRLKYSVQAACFTLESEKLPHYHGKANVVVVEDDTWTSRDRGVSYFNSVATVICASFLAFNILPFNFFFFTLLRK